VALQIINAGPDPEELCGQIRDAIAAAIEGAEIHVEGAGPGHFAIKVVSEVFAGKSRVKQQQLVYAAITPLMAGNNAPVHAVDRLECVTP